MGCFSVSDVGHRDSKRAFRQSQMLEGSGMESERQ